MTFAPIEHVQVSLNLWVGKTVYKALQPIFLVPLFGNALVIINIKKYIGIENFAVLKSLHDKIRNF